MAKHEYTDFISTRKASEILGVSLRTVQLWVENGTLDAWKTSGGHRRILLDSVNRVIDEREESLVRNTVTAGVAAGLIMVIVEDDKEIREAYSLSVTMTGLPVRVITAANGFEGLLQIGKYNPDIIMTDLMMPKMDGFEMLKAINANKGVEPCEVIVVTALNDAEARLKGLIDSNMTIMHKPIQFEKVESIIKSKLAAVPAVEQS